MNQIPPALQPAYDECRKIALGHYENFPVASVLIPRRMRPHVFALYAFMRTADDFADKPERPKAERLRLLSDWRKKLDETIRGEAPNEPIFQALGNTLSQCSLPASAPHAMLDAFEFDARAEVRFATFKDLRWYTARSADPVGQLILALWGYRDEKRIHWSDEICTALQLLNFIQDAREDLLAGRCYFPEEDLAQFGLDSIEDILAKGERLMLHECDRVERLLDSGYPLVESVKGRLRLELRATVLGARLMLRKIRAIQGRTNRQRPALTSRERRAGLLGALFGAKK